jgi:hypothetical protein
MREVSVSVARIEMHAVLCKRQLQPWSVDTGRLLCVWLPLLYILLLDCGPSRWSGSRVSLASVGDIVVFVPALALRRRNGLLNAFRFLPREILVCRTVVGANVLQKLVGVCDCGFYRQVVMSCSMIVLFWSSWVES